ncbi:hypothetical protein E2C01_031115 [Portunus trituberculatus]|uniref:Uncharacterized protein n=1 Tax=Portunus trituberculatus TaxID=210409 RepID=A0A5B7EX86_PORTR|nr:hypothetical protein [Portunus trituberculatus]
MVLHLKRCVQFYYPHDGVGTAEMPMAADWCCQYNLLLPKTGHSQATTLNPSGMMSSNIAVLYMPAVSVSFNPIITTKIPPIT